MAGIGPTVAMELAKFNKGLAKYKKIVGKDFQKGLRYISIKLTDNIRLDSPVDTGEFRAGWVPALRGMGQSAPVAAAPYTKKTSTEVARAQARGLKSCKWRTNLMSPSADVDQNDFYFWVENRTAHGVFLEYGVRRKGLRGTKHKESHAYLAVTRQGKKKGFVRANVKKAHANLEAWIKKGAA